MQEKTNSELPFSVGKGNILKSNTYFKGGHWTQRENMKFTMFIDFYRHIFTGNYNNRQVRIFVFMAEFMKTRNSVQCRTHFQKMMRQYKSVTIMIKQIRLLTGEQKYQKIISLYADEFQGLKPLIFDKISDKSMNHYGEQGQSQLATNQICLENSLAQPKQKSKAKILNKVLKPQAQFKPLQNENKEKFSQLKMMDQSYYFTKGANDLFNFGTMHLQMKKVKQLAKTGEVLSQNQQIEEMEQPNFNFTLKSQNRIVQQLNPSNYQYSIMSNLCGAFEPFPFNLDFIGNNRCQQKLVSSSKKQELMKEKTSKILECQQHWQRWLASAIRIQDLKHRIQSLEVNQINTNKY